MHIYRKTSLILIAFSYIFNLEYICLLVSTLFFQNDERNDELRMASEEQRKADENVLRLVEEQKVSQLESVLILLFSQSIATLLGLYLM